MENERYKVKDGRIWGGLFLLCIGIVLFMQQTGFPFPGWLFRWPSILIITGLFVGLRTRFRGAGWLILIIIGSIFMFDMINPGYALRRYTTPVFIIVFGLMMIFRPRRIRQERYRVESSLQGLEQPQAAIKNTGYNMKQDYLDSVAIFGGVRKIIVSKHFLGGEIVAIFGGNEIDLSQADINGQVILDVTQIFGGTKLILPSHWTLKTEMTALFGGIEDKRQLMTSVADTDKVLVIKGTSIFGGIDIRNY